MRIVFSASRSALISVFFTLIVVNSSLAQPGPQSFADLAETLTPTVVNISSTQKVENTQEFPEMPQFPPGSPFEDFFEEFMDRRGGGPMLPPASLGSGFVFDAENGYVITNNHVIRDADEVRVTFHNDETVEAEVIGRDEKTDIAVLKIDVDGRNLTAAKFGDSDIMRVGDWVLAIGNPFGLGGTVTTGIISARQRNINAGPYDDFIQTDASINRGNSGGPMFNLNGEVIGINTAIFSPSGGSVGIGFAIPSALAEPVVKQIIKYGRTRRGWLGVRIQSVTEEIAESLGLESEQGALVASITEGGPAEDAGFQPGDIILEFNGEPITEMRELPRLVAETEIGSNAEVVFWRDGKKQSVQTKIGELEKAEEDGLLLLEGAPTLSEEGTKLESLGFSGQELTPGLRENYDIPANVQGVVVTGVDIGSEAERKGILEGDVVVEVNQQAVSSPDAIKDILEQARNQGRNSVLFLINRQGDVRFIALKAGD